MFESETRDVKNLGMRQLKWWLVPQLLELVNRSPAHRTFHSCGWFCDCGTGWAGGQTFERSVDSWQKGALKQEVRGFPNQIKVWKMHQIVPQQMSRRPRGFVDLICPQIPIYILEIFLEIWKIFQLLKSCKGTESYWTIPPHWNDTTASSELVN